MKPTKPWVCVLCFPFVKGHGETARLEHQRTVHGMTKGHRQGLVTRRGPIKKTGIAMPREREREG